MNWQQYLVISDNKMGFKLRTCFGHVSIFFVDYQLLLRQDMAEIELAVRVTVVSNNGLLSPVD